MSINMLSTRQFDTLGSLGSLHSPSKQFPDELNPFELEIITKFDNIINILRQLEDHFTQARQEVIRKSTLEGKESDKICAIRARVITNKKRFYKSLEADIMSLDKIFQEQLAKISQDLISLKMVSNTEAGPEAEKTGKEIFTTYTLIPSTGCYEGCTKKETINCCPFGKSVAVPCLKKLDNNIKPISIGRPVARPLFKASSTTEVELQKRKEEQEQQHLNNFQRRKTFAQPESSNIPEDKEKEEEESNRALSHIKLELSNEDEGEGGEMRKSASKPLRSEKGHGFRLSQVNTETIRKDFLMEMPICDDH